jgi:cytochrome c oxidase cbb3-type subunit III
VKPGNKLAGLVLSGALFGSLYLIQGQTDAQTPAAVQNPPREDAPSGAATPASPRDFPARPKEPQDVLDRGKATFGVSCAFCHGSDAAGGEVGPNLMRSSVVLEDQKGELIGPIVHGSRVDQGMPRINLTDAQISDVAAWLHSLNPIGKPGPGNENINIVSGDPKGGEVYFQKDCASCHSATGDLAGIASRITNPKTLQQTWLLPGGANARSLSSASAAPAGVHIPPVIVTLTCANGQRVEGNLYRIDDFYVGLTTADGVLHSFRRDGDIPKVEIHDPLAVHRELIERYTDKDIHNVTAYLVTLK